MNWTLRIKGLGNIVDEAIDIKQMTIVSGPDMISKQNIMNLLYTIKNMPFYKFNDKIEISEEYESHWDKIVKLHSKYVLNSNDKLFMVQLLNNWLDKAKYKIVQLALGTAETIDGLAIEFNQEILDIALNVKPRPENDFLSVEKRYEVYWTIDGKDTAIYNMSESNTEYLDCIIKLLFDGLLGKCDLATNQAVFVPACSAGVMATHKMVVSNTIKYVYSAELESDDAYANNRSNLPIGVVDFMRMLATLREPMEYKMYSAEQIEEKVLHGKVCVQTSPFISIKFMPDGSDKTYPIEIMPAAIQSVASIVIALRYSGINCNTIMIEDVGNHLDSVAQMELTKVLVGLTNSGMNIIMSTDSPYVICTLNNSMYAEYLVQKYTGDKKLKVLELPINRLRCDVSAYSVEEGQLYVTDRSEEFILDDNRIDKASEYINDIYYKLIDIEFVKEDKKDE